RDAGRGTALSDVLAAGPVRAAGRCRDRRRAGSRDRHDDALSRLRRLLVAVPRRPGARADVRGVARRAAAPRTARTPSRRPAPRQPTARSNSKRAPGPPAAGRAPSGAETYPRGRPRDGLRKLGRRRTALRRAIAPSVSPG